MLSISSAFDAGNIIVNSITGYACTLSIRDDVFTELEQTNHKQWFYFRANNCKGQYCNFVIENAGKCSYPEAWKDYKVCATYDRKYWFRISDTAYDEKQGHLLWNVTPEHDQIYFAFFAAYSHQQHLDLVAWCGSTNLCSIRTLGTTLDGRPLDMIVTGSGSRKIWCIGQQHPGETQAGWWMEGFLRRLLDPHDALTRQLRKDATFYIVPCMNPDGAFRGHLRTNACGANLNREWLSREGYEAPTLERSPEVYYVLKEADRVGVDFWADVHGDEALPYNFISGSEGIPKWGPRLEHLQKTFSAHYRKSTPDFQEVHGYDIDPPKGANMSICSNQIAERFDCLSFTLEMPYKDTADTPEPVQEWCPERAMKFGASILEPIARILPELR